MRWWPIGKHQWARGGDSAADRLANSDRLGRRRVVAIAFRTIFIISMLIVTVRVSMPQSETIWTAYDTPGDLVRLALGFGVCVWLIIQLFVIPKDPGAYRTWLYLGLVAVPFAVICIIGVW